jgi:hypothetical protein
MLMTYFGAGQDVPEGSCSPSVLHGTVPVVFGSREIALNVGFVAGRIRLFNELHSGWMTDSSALADLLTLLPVSAELGGQPGPRFVRVRLEEPVPGIGMVTYPLSWGADDGSGRLLPVLEMGLRLRAGWPGQTFLMLAGTVWLPIDHLGADALDVQQSRRGVNARVEEWLSRLARAMSGQAAGLPRRPLADLPASGAGVSPPVPGDPVPTG